MRTGFLIACGCAALALALGGCGGGGGSSAGGSGPTATTPSSTPTATTPSTPTSTTPTVTTTTQTSPPAATISQVQAKAAARAAAFQGSNRHVSPDQWDARCTAVGGRDRADTWRCQVASVSGQCSGTLTAYASAPGVARAREVQVACTQ